MFYPNDCREFVFKSAETQGEATGDTAKNGERRRKEGMSFNSSKCTFFVEEEEDGKRGIFSLGERIPC